jgi:metal-responsive CopG/Arc/MetJ family transcriptional regulator
MARPRSDSTVLTIRVPVALEKRISREARRRRQSRSEVARAALEAGLGGSEAGGLAAEARRQSLLVSRHPSERETLDFLLHAADTAGWK